MLKDHIKWLRLMLERCRQIQLSLNIKKCIFATPIGILLGHVVYKEGIKLDLAKIKVIIELKPPSNPKKNRIFIGHTGYYRKFIRHYSYITQNKTSRSTYLKIPRLVEKVPCTHRCFNISIWCNLNPTNR